MPLDENGRGVASSMSTLRSYCSATTFWHPCLLCCARRGSSLQHTIASAEFTLAAFSHTLLANGRILAAFFLSQHSRTPTRPPFASFCSLSAISHTILTYGRFSAALALSRHSRTRSLFGRFYSLGILANGRFALSEHSRKRSLFASFCSLRILAHGGFFASFCFLSAFSHSAPAPAHVRRRERGGCLDVHTALGLDPSVG